MVEGGYLYQRRYDELKQGLSDKQQEALAGEKPRLTPEEQATVETIQDVGRRVAFGKGWKYSDKVEEFLRENQSVSITEFDQQPELLACENNVISLFNGEIIEGDHMLTLQAKTNFDPTAECPHWDWLIGEMFDHDEERIRLFHQFLGMSISGSVDRFFAVIHGPRYTGKSTAIAAVQRLLGNDLAIRIPQEQVIEDMGNRREYYMASLRGKRLAYVDETSENACFDAHRVKELTGGDQKVLAGRYPGGRPFNFTLQATLVLMTNSIPQFKRRDDAFLARMVVIPTRSEPIPKDAWPKDIDTLLSNELPGILNRLVSGYQDWKEHGLVIPFVCERQANLYMDNVMVK